MDWEPIREPHLYGYRATRGGHAVEVVRAYAGDWRWFGVRCGESAVLHGVGGQADCLATAKADAARWLRKQAV